MWPKRSGRLNVWRLCRSMTDLCCTSCRCCDCVRCSPAPTAMKPGIGTSSTVIARWPTTLVSKGIWPSPQRCDSSPTTLAELAVGQCAFDDGLTRQRFAPAALGRQVDLRGLVRDRMPVEVRCQACARGGGALLRCIRIVESGTHRVGQARDVPGRERHSGLSIDHRLTQSTDIRRDQRCARGGGFQCDDPERLIVAWQYDDVSVV